MDHHVLTVEHFSTDINSLSYLPRIKYFGLPISVTWKVERKVNDEESSLSVGFTSLL